MLISLISKANGPDRISAKMLKETATSIIDKTIQYFDIVRKIPEKWKLFHRSHS